MKFKIGGYKPSFYIQVRLELAYAWITHSNNHISPYLKRKVKSVIVDQNWNEQAYYFLSQTMIFFDIDETYHLVDSAFHAYEKNPEKDTFTLQFVALIAVNFLNCCYHQKGRREYVKRVVDFLRELPIDNALGLASILGTYYEALFNEDYKMTETIAEILNRSGYLSMIEDTLESNQNNMCK